MSLAPSDTALAEISVQHLHKSFGRRVVLDGISFNVEKGGFLTIFGPNGAGKTTTVRILSTLVAASSGQVSVAGRDVTVDPMGIRSQIGLISHHPLLYLDLQADENLRFYGKIYGVEDLEERIDELLHRVELSHRRYDVVRSFSKGMLQRLAIARALLHRPRILFLDEPHSGLDPHAVDILDGLLGDIRGDHTFVMITHDLDKGLELCTDAIIIDEGRIVFKQQKASLDRTRFEEHYREAVGRPM